MPSFAVASEHMMMIKIVMVSDFKEVTSSGEIDFFSEFTEMFLGHKGKL